MGLGSDGAFLATPAVTVTVVPTAAASAAPPVGEATTLTRRLSNGIPRCRQYKLIHLNAMS